MIVPKHSRPSVLISLLGMVLAGSLGCPSGVDAPHAESADGREPIFVEVAEESGLTYRHHNGATGQFHFPELMQAGVGLVDVDDDGYLDVYLVQSVGANRLFRNLGDGTFEEVPGAAGAADGGYGVGVVAADYDRDGDVDLYVTNLGRNTLLRNDGPAGFVDVTLSSGVGDEGYSTSATFADIDGDGDLDLYVCNYVAWTPEIERTCQARNGLRDYCSPGSYGRPQPDTLYRNEGDGTFTDISLESGIRASAGTGLGVVAADFDGDGLVDFFVANDQMPNFLWINRGDGTFVDEALIRGVALNGAGRAEAGMGVAIGDFESDGDWDLFVVHLDGETNTFYRNHDGHFDDETDSRGLGWVSKPYTGFGVGAIDFDCDGYLDLFIANGSVRLRDSMESGQYGEPNQLLLGSPDGNFREVANGRNAAFADAEVSRSAAFGDYDNDGDIDVVIANNDGPVRLLRNEGCDGRSWLIVQLVGRTVDRDGIGARVTVEAEGRSWTRLVQTAYSYAASNDPRVHFGLGNIAEIDRVTVEWPVGTPQTIHDVEPRQILRVEQPSGEAM